MAFQHKNNGASKLAGSLTSGALALSVQTGEGSRFPTGGGADWFPVTILKTDGSFEIVKCTSRSGDVLTIVRAQEGTAAQAFSAGDRVELRLTSAALSELQANTSAAQADADDAQARITTVETVTVPLAAKAVQFDAMTGAADLPKGTTAQRPASPTGSEVRLNTDTGKFEGYDGSKWGPLGGGASGGSNDDIFYENGVLVTADYTIGQLAQLPCTISIATPGVITQPNTFTADQPVRFTTTGALPTGLVAGTPYYVISAGLSGSSFRVSATVGGAAINTSGSQSGVHTCGPLKNAKTAGPVTIKTGVTVTIPTGSTWTVT